MTKSTIDSNAKNKEVKGGYGPVNGLRMYYEIHGTGEPLVLLQEGMDMEKFASGVGFWSVVLVMDI
jgi:hypothetical protein